MINEWLKNNNPTDCDTLTEDGACIFRDTLKQRFDGKILGRSNTNKQKLRMVKPLKKVIDHLPQDTEYT